MSDWTVYFAERFRKITPRRELAVLAGAWSAPGSGTFTLSTVAVGYGSAELVAPIAETGSTSVFRTIQSEGGRLSAVDVGGFYNANGGTGAGSIRVTVWETDGGAAAVGKIAEYYALLPAGTTPGPTVALAALMTAVASAADAWVQIELALNPATNAAAQTSALQYVDLQWSAP